MAMPPVSQSDATDIPDRHGHRRGTRPKGMGVVNEADHSGKPLHGVDAPGTSLTTRALLGGVREDARTPEEFLRLVRG